jgi:hypothetical protein
MQMTKPNADQYPEYFQKYINCVNEDDLRLAFENQLPAAQSFFNAISSDYSGQRYAPGKWTIKEVLQHIIDTERVFSYRALCIARGELQTLPSFDEKEYADYAMGSTRQWPDLIAEFTAVRRSTTILFDGLPETSLLRMGNVSNYTISPLALGFITIGHAYHHIMVIEERYLGS